MERDAEYWAIYAVIVAGKSASFAESRMEALDNLWCKELPANVGWFTRILEMWRTSALDWFLRQAKTGNYTKLNRCLPILALRDVETCTVEELEEIPGIGPKTSRFFMLMTRPKSRVAALDVHVLRWLREQGHDAPEQTPQSRRKYRELEEIFLKEADKRGMTPRDLDWEIWSTSSGG
jgi:hypothetical protein